MYNRSPVLPKSLPKLHPGFQGRHSDLRGGDEAPHPLVILGEHLRAFVLHSPGTLHTDDKGSSAPDSFPLGQPHSEMLMARTAAAAAESQCLEVPCKGTSQLGVRAAALFPMHTL